MSRRTRDSEVEIGSDSFLDIIANIVGILIILIVVAGVRVSKAPLLSPPVAEATSPVPSLPAPEPIIEETPEPIAPDVMRTAPIVRRAPLVAPKPTYRRSPALVKQARELETELKQLQSTAASLAAGTQAIDHQKQVMGEKLQNAADAVRSAEESYAASRRRLIQRDEELKKAHAQFLNLQYKLQEAARAAGPVKRIEHKLTPVSSVVSGTEIHFQLREDRVAFVPLEDLLERLRSQIQRQKDWLLKFRRHEGQVGPVDGYIMRYVVERHSMSVIDELRYGSGMVRMGISQWQIVPTEATVTESLDEALRAGSAFQRALLAAPVDSTLTFWVYPDSFDLYRELQQAAHTEGYKVAGRPLPFGVPIAGSPQGTRSAGQ